MGVGSVYYLHGIYLPTGALISQIEDLTPQVTTDRLVAYASGWPQPLFVANKKQTIEITFRTTAVKQILDAIVAGGNNYGLDCSAGNVDLLYRKGYPSGLRYADASLVHQRFRIASGFMHWQSIAAVSDPDATITCRLIPTYDGTNAPVVPAGTVALSGTSAAGTYWGLGPVGVNGALLTGEQDWSLDLGETLERATGGGEMWESYVGIRTINPVARIRLLREPWANAGLLGTSLTALSLYLRAKSSDAGFVANGTPSHIKITAAGGNIVPESVKGGGNNPAETNLIAQLRAATSVAQTLGISTASAITT